VKQYLPMTVIFSSLLALNVSANQIENSLKVYESEGASQFSAKRGEAMWKRNFPDPKRNGKVRNCGSCHTDNLEAMGKHVKTGKLIKPLSLRTNAKRFTKRKKIEKWFKRNCKWVLGRECTPQEKGDFLVFLKNN